jgi:hypothetical protein
MNMRAPHWRIIQRHKPASALGVARCPLAYSRIRPIYTRRWIVFSRYIQYAGVPLQTAYFDGSASNNKRSWCSNRAWRPQHLLSP